MSVFAVNPGCALNFRSENVANFAVHYAVESKLNDPFRKNLAVKCHKSLRAVARQEKEGSPGIVAREGEISAIFAVFAVSIQPSPETESIKHLQPF